MAAKKDPAAETAGHHLRRLAWVLDEFVRLPGGYRIGLDGIVGLIPGVGDALGLAAGSYLILRAREYGVPGVVLVRMAGNVLLDALVGAIPLLGDLFDFAFKANRRNLALMERYLQDGRRVRRDSWLRVVGTVLALLAATLLFLFILFRLIRWLWNLAAG